MSYQYGDIMLVHGDNLFSETIQNMTHSFFSHAALCTDPGKIAEMTRYGFQYQDNHYLSGSRPYAVLRHRLLLPQSPGRARYMAVIKNCIDNFRRTPPQYDYFEILNQAIKIIFSRGDTLTRDGETYISANLLMAAGERLICSALVDAVYASAGIDLFPGQPSRHIVPADLARLASGEKPALSVVFKSPGTEDFTRVAEGDQ